MLPVVSTLMTPFKIGQVALFFLRSTSYKNRHKLSSYCCFLQRRITLSSQVHCCKALLGGRRKQPANGYLRANSPFFRLFEGGHHPTLFRRITAATRHSSALEAQIARFPRSAFGATFMYSSVYVTDFAHPLAITCFSSKVLVTKRNPEM